MMKSAPTSSFKMSQPQFLLQLFVIALDDPTLLGQADQVRSLVSAGRVDSQYLVGSASWLRPFDQQPLLGTGLALQ